MADFKDTLNSLNNTPDTTTEFDKQDIEANKGITVLSYLGLLVLIPLFLRKDSKFARFHANQGLVLLIAETVVTAILGVLTKVPLLGWIFSIVNTLVGIAFFVLMIVGIVNVANGKAKEIPIFGSIKLLS